MKVLVLGGGVVGVTTAYYLSKDGHEVGLVERHAGPAEETSFANAGLIAPGHAYAWSSPRAPKILLKSLFQKDQALRFKLRPDPRLWAWSWLFLRQCNAAAARINTLRKHRLCVYSQAALQALVAETGLRYDSQRGGLLYLYRTAESFARGTANMHILADDGQRMEVVDRDRAAAIEPALAPVKRKIAGAIYCPSDESGDARIFTCGLAALTAERGVSFHYETTVRRIEAEGDRITRVVTDQGDLAADAYVLALGCQAPLLARPLGLKLPIYPIKGYSVTLPVTEHDSPPTIGGVDEDNLVAYCRMGDRLRITATAEFAGYDTSHKPSDYHAMLAAARDLFPDGGDYSEPSYWAGLRPMTPEGTPILGPARQRNLYLNCGHGHMGWTMACGTARIVTDLIAGRPPDIDLDGMTLR